MDHNTTKRGYTDAAGEEDSWTGRIIVQGQIPKWPLDLNFRVEGMLFKTRLKAVSRSRVVTIMVGSWGALLIENPRVLPSASVSVGLTSVMSTNCPALKAHSAGFSRLKGHCLFCYFMTVSEPCHECRPVCNCAHVSLLCLTSA